MLQLALTVLGITGALASTGHLFGWVRWAGVSYLLYLRVQAWRAPTVNFTEVKPDARSAHSISIRGFIVSLTNPKLLWFYDAFFPQFVAPGASLEAQPTTLSILFLLIAASLDCCWAILADNLRGFLATRGHLRNRLTGGFYIAAALGLVGARRAS